MNDVLYSKALFLKAKIKGLQEFLKVADSYKEEKPVSIGFYSTKSPYPCYYSLCGVTKEVMTCAISEAKKQLQVYEEEFKQL